MQGNFNLRMSNKLNIDENSLKWIFRAENISAVYPPAIAEIDGVKYKINYFETESSADFYMTNCTDFQSALELSLNFYGKPENIVEAAAFYSLSKNLGLSDFAEKKLGECGYKGNKTLETLKNIDLLSYNMKKYAAQKNIPAKTLAIFFKLKNGLQAVVEEYVKRDTPSVQNFRNLVTLLFDMNPDTFCYDHEKLKLLAGEKSAVQDNFLNLFYKIISNVNAEIKSMSNFETSEISVCITGRNEEEIFQKLTDITQKKEIFKQIYKLLEENDIC